jgi:hypothetical protein
LFRPYRFCCSVDAQWLTMKNDWREAKKRHKMQQELARMGLDSSPTSPSVSAGSRSESNDVYDKDMDAMRCILYLHGGIVIAPSSVTHSQCLTFLK